ncbi:MAG: PHP domain-containing protein [Bacilli bacterium]|nr:PHP domain-containing protein [Bacilli bacterium]
MSKIRAEFHTHTRFSKDSILNKFFILFMLKLKKIKLIAITDHNEVKGAIKYQKFLKKFNIDVIVGEEVMTDSGEIIGLFLNKKIEPFQSPELTVKQIKEQNGIVYLPHPYDEKRYKTVLKEEKQIKLKDEIDFIEIHNGRNISEKYSDKQKDIQQKLKITPIIGSDAHTFIELGRNYIEIEYKNIEDFKNNMKDIVEKSVSHKKKCIKLAHTITKFARIIKMIEKGEFNELYRTIFKRRRK